MSLSGTVDHVRVSLSRHRVAHTLEDRGGTHHIALTGTNVRIEVSQDHPMDIVLTDKGLVRPIRWVLRGPQFSADADEFVERCVISRRV